MFYRKWFDHMIIDHILSKQGVEALNSYYYATTYPDVYAAAERLFGSWREAIEACGLDYSTIRKYKEWSREKVLDEVKLAYQENRPLSSKYIQDNSKPLYMAAVKRFKSWGKTLALAGIDYSKIRLRRSMTKEDIEREILELSRKNTDLAYTNMRENYQYLLAAAMKKCGGGSWDKARKGVGILTNFRLPKHKRGGGKPQPG